MIIRQTLDLLSSEDWLIKDKDIQIAKGLYEIPVTFKELKNKYKNVKN